LNIAGQICVAGFDMPVEVCLNDNGPTQLLKPTTAWQKTPAKGAKALTADADYYVLTKEVK